VRRGHRIELYDFQLLAVIELARGHIAQMQTGEGKTFVAITTAAHLALAGRGVHVMPPNTYLAKRDAATAEKQHYPGRAELLRQDTARDSLFGL